MGCADSIRPLWRVAAFWAYFAHLEAESLDLGKFSATYVFRPLLLWQEKRITLSVGLFRERAEKEEVAMEACLGLAVLI